MNIKQLLIIFVCIQSPWIMGMNYDEDAQVAAATALSNQEKEKEGHLENWTDEKVNQEFQNVLAKFFGELYPQKSLSVDGKRMMLGEYYVDDCFFCDCEGECACRKTFITTFIEKNPELVNRKPIIYSKCLCGRRITCLLMVGASLVCLWKARLYFCRDHEGKRQPGKGIVCLAGSCICAAVALRLWGVL